MLLVSIAAQTTTRSRCVLVLLLILLLVPFGFSSRVEITKQLRTVKKKLKVYPPPPSAKTACKDPVAAVAEAQIATLDPTGARKTLFSRKNPEAAKVGDILLVKFKTGDPYSGVCLNIRHRGVDTSILLRNQLTRVGVEMWVKIFSPNVQGIEVVQRREKRARRARLYYMRCVLQEPYTIEMQGFVLTWFIRKPEHDMGSVQNIVHQYVRQKQASGSSGDRRNRTARVGTKQQGKR